MKKLMILSIMCVFGSAHAGWFTKEAEPTAQQKGRQIRAQYIALSLSRGITLGIAPDGTKSLVNIDTKEAHALLAWYTDRGDLSPEVREIYAGFLQKGN